MKKAPEGATHYSAFGDLWYRVHSANRYDFWNEGAWQRSIGQPLCCDLTAIMSPAVVPDDLSRELRRAYRWRDIYRRLALLGWLAFVGALMLQDAKADTLPGGSIVCVDEDAWLTQMNAKPLELAVGCVFTYRDNTVDVERTNVFGGSEVRVGDMLVWVNRSEVLP